MQELFTKINKSIKVGQITGLILPLCIAACIIIIFVPLPTDIIDILLSANIAIGLIILMTTLFVKRPLDFSIFPTVLLTTTLFRLVLSIATTRLILSRAGEYGEEAAGKVILSFASFISGDSIVVGFIIFVIIFIIQFIVITKGATRVAEVAARFTLDAMPGKQMAIDADLNAGLINEAEAKVRREEIAQEADFHGAMDGASKFVRGDAIAGIIITIINICAGLFIGIVMYGMTFQDALYVFTKLTIGDGLVTQVPALLISLAAGLLVTRSNTPVNLPEQFVGQMASRPVVLFLTAFFLFVLTLTDLPAFPLWTMAASSIGIALIIGRKTKKEKAIETQQQEEEERKNQKPDEQVEDYLKIDAMELEIGVGLIPLADPARGGDLLERIHRLRNEVASEIGIILPKVRIRDSFQLTELQYRFKIAGQPVAGGMVHPDMYLAMDTQGAAAGAVQGIETTDPAYGSPALWIDEATREQAEIFGYTVVEPNAVIITHLLETIRKYADEILTRDGTQQLIDELTKFAPAAVSELIPGIMSVGEVQKVLQLLLQEQVPIKQLGTILEVLGEHGKQTKDPILLSGWVRIRLARTICTRYRNTDNVMHVITLDPELENQVRAGFEHTESGLFFRLSPGATDHLCKKILAELDKLTQYNLPAIVVVDPRIRTALKHMTSTNIPGLVVLSFLEITRDTQLIGVGVVTQ
ncbi:MAG: flagellar biosynthesis protein FlhA [Planctomycetaceae bacterium]|nr:flagellar biosynthesis protein FlhA [Planctomycetaceae bacterium]